MVMGHEGCGGVGWDVGATGDFHIIFLCLYKFRCQLRGLILFHYVGRVAGLKLIMMQ